MSNGTRAALLVLVSLCLAGGATAQEVITVTNLMDSGAGSLRQAILDANASDATQIAIQFDASLTGTLMLASSLPVIDAEGKVLDIDASATASRIEIAGAGHRVFFVTSGDVRIASLDVTGALALGGDGGTRAGGGLGAGAGLFVDEGATVELVEVDFDDNTAQGGAGGDHASVSGGGGGGGLAGDGGDGDDGGGGGGGLDETGARADGTDGSFDSGGDGGGFKDGQSTGGVGGGVGQQPTPALAYGGGGGAGPGGAGGGDGGAFGGGGGATGAGEAGAGGFGGGGAGSEDGSFGMGGFGGGDGGAFGTSGGGGSAFGGAVFVREGGTLRITNSNFGNSTANGVSAGLGGTTGVAGADGEAAGQDLYLMTGVALEVNVDTAIAPQATINGSVSGEGGLTKQGDGTLVLAGVNDYSGGTEVQGGILQGGVDSLQGSISLAAGTTLAVVEGAGNETLTADVSGQGSLRKSGMGTVTLEPAGGSNTYSGGTQIQAGTLVARAGALPGAGAVGVGGGTTLRFDQPAASDESFAGGLQGTGAIEKVGDGTTRLTGTSTFAGTTTVSAGTLVGDSDSLSGDIQNDATLVFDQGGAGAYTGALTGTGDLAKQGGGALTLSGVSSAYAGATTVSAGTLLLDGTLGGDATVGSGAFWGGTGALGGTLTLQAGSTLAPGDSLATSAVGGDLVVEPGARYRVEVELGTMNAGRIDVAGDATLAGNGTVEVDLSGVYDGPTSYLVVDAGSRTGQFADVVDDLPFFLVTPDYSVADDVSIAIERDPAASFEGVAVTPNQMAVGRVLDDATGTPDFDDVRSELENLSLPELLSAYDEIGGEALSAFTTAQLANGYEAGRVVSARMRQVGGREIGSPGTVDFLVRGGGEDPRTRLAGYGEAMLASADDVDALRLAAAGPVFGAAPPPEGDRFGFWVDGYGTLGSLDGDTNASGTGWWSGGVLAGLDVVLGRHGLLGLTGGWARLDVDVDHRSLADAADVYQGGLYGAWVGERLYVGALARYAWTSFDTRRRLVFGDVDRTATADFDGQEVGGFLELGYVAWDPGGWQLEPMVAGHFAWLRRDGFTESGADSLDLVVDQESWTSIVSSVGVRIHKRFALDFGLAISPEIWGGWGHQFGDNGRPLSARFQGALTDGQFRVTGATSDRDGGQFGAGWAVSRANDVTFFLYYDGNANADLIAHGVTAGILIRW